MGKSIILTLIPYSSADLKYRKYPSFASDATVKTKGSSSGIVMKKIYKHIKQTHVLTDVLNI